MSDRQATSAERSLQRDPLGTILVAAGLLVGLGGLLFTDLRWMLGFAVIVFVFGVISTTAHAHVSD